MTFKPVGIDENDHFPPRVEERLAVDFAGTGAADAAQAYAIQRSHHTGSQLASTVSDLQEAVEDYVANMLVSGGTLSLAYNDGTGKLTITATGTDAEAVRDTIGAALVGTTGVSVGINDALDTITFSIAANALSISQVNGLQVAIDAKLDKGFAGKVAGDMIVVKKDPTTGFWPASWTGETPVYTGGSASAGVRPTSRADICVNWKGPDPSPGIVTSGTAGMRDQTGGAIGDIRMVTP